MTTGRGGAPASPAPYRRTPNSLAQWMVKAAKDFALLGRVERLLEVDKDMLASLVRAASAEHEVLLQSLADLVERHVAIVDAATEAHEALIAAKLHGRESS